MKDYSCPKNTKAFLQCDAPVEFLEGTTAAGKTTVGLFKFMLKVAESPKKLHILAADDTGLPRRTLSTRIWVFWMISVCWWSTRAMALVSTKCLTCYSTPQAAIRLFCCRIWQQTQVEGCPGRPVWMPVYRRD